MRRAAREAVCRAFDRVVLTSSFVTGDFSSDKILTMLQEIKVRRPWRIAMNGTACWDRI